LILAFDAHEILHALGKKIGKPSKLQTWLETMPERFQLQFRYVWNYCKHSRRDLEEGTPHDPRHADVLIYFAGQCYGDVSGKPTPLMLAFKLRFLLEHPESGFLETVEDVSKLANVYQASARISRQEFLDEYLPLIQSNLPRFHSGDPPELEKP
jgi:hypothetical protein